MREPQLPDAAADPPRFDDETIRPVLRYPRGKRARFVLGDKGKRTPRWKSVERFTNVVGALPRGNITQVNFRRLSHDPSRSRLAERSTP